MVVVVFGPNLVMVRVYSWSCTQELLLAVIGRLSCLPGIEPRWAACKVLKCPTNCTISVGLLISWAQTLYLLSELNLGEGAGEIALR